MKCSTACCYGGQEPVVVNLDIAPIERPENVPWVDPVHKG